MNIGEVTIWIKELCSVLLQSVVRGKGKWTLELCPDPRSFVCPSTSLICIMGVSSDSEIAKDMLNFNTIVTDPYK